MYTCIHAFAELIRSHHMVKVRDGCCAQRKLITFSHILPMCADRVDCIPFSYVDFQGMLSVKILCDSAFLASNRFS